MYTINLIQNEFMDVRLVSGVSTVTDFCSEERMERDMFLHKRLFLLANEWELENTSETLDKIFSCSSPLGYWS